MCQLGCMSMRMCMCSSNSRSSSSCMCRCLVRHLSCTRVLHVQVPRAPFELAVDVLVGQVGYRPSYDLSRELHVHVDYRSEGLMAPSHVQLASGALAFETEEPRFYVLGTKSCGRASNFCLSEGYAQVEAAISRLAAELEPFGR